MFKKMKELDFDKLKKKAKEIISNRLALTGILLLTLMIVLVHRLFVLQILEGEEHQANFDYKVEKNIPGQYL